MLTTKKCTRCDTIKDISEFSKNKTKPNGINTECKICVKEYNKKYYLLHREKIKATTNEYYQSHREESLKKKKEYYFINREKFRESSKEWYKNNIDHVKKYREENSDHIIMQRQDYHARNKIDRNNKSKEWKFKNKNKVKLYNDKYYIDNQEKIQEYRNSEQRKITYTNSYHKRRDMMINSSNGEMPVYNISRLPLSEELESLLCSQSYRCNNCGCDISEHKHLDHHIPLSKGGTHTIDNVVWLCPSCNLSKSNKIPDTLLLV